MNFPADEDELAAIACAAAAPAPAPAAARAAAAAVVVVFTDATLGVDLKIDEVENRIVFLRATAESPAAALAPGLVLSRIDGAAVGAVDSRDRYREIIDHIRAAPRPLTLEFAEGA